MGRCDYSGFKNCVAALERSDNVVIRRPPFRHRLKLGYRITKSALILLCYIHRQPPRIPDEFVI